MTIESLLSIKSALVLGVFAIFLLLERWRPAELHPLLLRIGHAPRAAWERIGKVAGLFSLNAIAGPLFVIPVTWWAGGIELGLRPTWWGWMLDIIILDLWIYAWHRANHIIPFLWRFHQVHHLDELLDTTSAFRFHVGEVLLSAIVRTVPIILLGIPLSTVILFEALLLTCAIFHHSDAKMPVFVETWLAKIIVTPGIHWIHHHARRDDTDSNYGLLFSFWDRLFGSKSLTRRFAGMPLGVERMADRSLWRLIIAPFGRQPVDPAIKPAPDPSRR